MCRARCWVSEGTIQSFLGAGVHAGLVGDWSLFENCTVDASICGQVFKGARWMPWHQEPMKDGGGRDRPRGAVNRAVMGRSRNGETPQLSWAVTRGSTHRQCGGNVGKSHFSVPAGRENNRDSGSSGERNWMRLNRMRVRPGRGCACGVVGSLFYGLPAV